MNGKILKSCMTINEFNSTLTLNNLLNNFSLLFLYYLFILESSCVRDLKGCFGNMLFRTISNEKTQVWSHLDMLMFMLFQCRKSKSSLYLKEK